MKRILTNLGVMQIFGSLLLIIAFMFVSNYYVYQNSISSIYEKVAQNNTLAVKSMIGSYDNNFRTLSNMMHSISALPYDALDSNDGGSIDMSMAYMMQDSLATMATSVDFIEDIIVFYDHWDLAITSKGTSSFKLLFNNKYKNSQYNADYWRNYMRSKHAFKLFPGQYYKLDSESYQKTNKKLMVAVDGNKIRRSDKNIMILIDESAFNKKVNQKLIIPGASLMILDQNRQVVLNTDPTTDSREMLDEIYLNSTNEASLTKKDYEYHFYKSDFNGYIYINKIPYEFNNIDSVSQANRVMMITTIICCIVLSIFLSFFLYRPVKRILHQLGRTASSGNDFRRIHSDIVRMQTEIDAYQHQLNAIHQEARRIIFLQALDEYSHPSEQNLQLQKHFADLFRTNQFVLILFHLSARSGDQKQAKTIDELGSALQACLGDQSAGLFYERQQQFVALVNINQTSEREALIKRLNGQLAQLEKEGLSEYSIRAVVSKPYASDIANIKRAYHNVMNGMLYRCVNDTSIVMDMQNIHYEWGIYFSFEKIEKLSNYVANGKLKEARIIISETMKENAVRGSHHHQLTHIAKTMFFYLLRHIKADANIHEEMYQLEHQFLEKIDHAHDYMVIENALMEAVKFIAKHSVPDQGNKLNPAFISQYIELHYMENLYLDHIAEVMETSPKYFSSYFKKTFGVNYVEYLNKVRLSHAREMLKDTTYTVAEIGEKTGYHNSSTFSTTFRKYYGISPSDYRKQKMS